MSLYARLALFLLLAASAAFAQQPRPYLTEPALSPDRKEIAFVSGGDIWTVPSTDVAVRELLKQLGAPRSTSPR
jgi:hypothetical protein